tara:strand:- start:2522 stop:4249 length:1728 start_codon:yes stop_codon:yes gene_type:complete
MKKRKNKNINERSFYFQEYDHNPVEKFSKDKFQIAEDRLYLLFFVFFCLIFIFSIKIFSTSLQFSNNDLQYNTKKNIFKPLRNDILDRNGEPIARNIKVYHAAIKPKFISDKKKLILKLKLLYPNLNVEKLKKKIEKEKYFYIKQNLTENERRKLWSLGEKSIILESSQTRVYPHKNLFSHVLGQIDLDNSGISGIEKYFDKELRNLKKHPVKLSLDVNLQYLIRDELLIAVESFRAKGAASLLIDIENGEVLSLISLPDYDLNKRQDIISDDFTNKITKGVFELGSIFKTFTVALALEKNLYKPNSIIKNIPNKIHCSKFIINEHDEMPDNLSLKDILIRSSNIGTIKVARKLGKDNLKNFLENLNLLNTKNIELNEIGSPLFFNWNKCKLETVSFGHGITTTPLQAATAYGSILNGGRIIEPTIIKNKNINLPNKKIVSEDTSKKMMSILREVVTSKDGTAKLAEVSGYHVGGKTGTAKKNLYGKYTNNKLTSFISAFPSTNPKFVLLVLFDEPQAAPQIVYNYMGNKISGIQRNDSGWNSAYTAGKIIQKIGPILAINKIDFYDDYVVKKSN